MRHIHMPDIPFTAPAPPLAQNTEVPGHFTRRNRKGGTAVVGIGPDLQQSTVGFDKSNFTRPYCAGTVLDHWSSFAVLCTCIRVSYFRNFPASQ